VDGLILDPRKISRIPKTKTMVSNVEGLWPPLLPISLIDLPQQRWRSRRVVGVRKVEPTAYHLFVTPSAS
jgi:hypothetical protein